MQSDFSKILVTEEEIDKTVRRMAEEISRDYEGKNLVLLGILKGSVVFMGDLMKRLSIPVVFQVLQYMLTLLTMNHVCLYQAKQNHVQESEPSTHYHARTTD